MIITVIEVSLQHILQSGNSLHRYTASDTFLADVMGIVVVAGGQIKHHCRQRAGRDRGMTNFSYIIKTNLNNHDNPILTYSLTQIT